MTTSQARKALFIAIAASTAAAFAAAAPARAVDQGVWLQEQLAISDGGAYPAFVPGNMSGDRYKADSEDIWLQRQLAISDGTGSSNFVPGPDSEKPYTIDAQSVWLQEQLAVSDGWAPIYRRDTGASFATAPRTDTALVK